MGLLGAWLVSILCNWGNLTEEEIPQQRSYLYVVVVNIVITLCFSFVPFVDWSAHLGGLIGGMFVAAAIFSSKIKEGKYRPWVRIVGVVGTIVCLVMATVQIHFFTHPSRDLLHICKLFRQEYNDPTMPC
jgi:energy-converting hydrogenase Eha subunit G